MTTTDYPLSPDLFDRPRADIPGLVRSRPMAAETATSLPEAALGFGSVAGHAEPKYDGMRLFLVRYQDGSIDILSRNLRTQLGKLPHIEAVLKTMPCGTILDGEVIVPVENSGLDKVLEFKNLWSQDIADIPLLSDFSETMKVMGAKAGNATNDAVSKTRVVLFDVLAIGGYDLTNEPLVERANQLCELLNNAPVRSVNNGVITQSPWLEFNEHNLQSVFNVGGEGLMAKDSSSPYYAGARTVAWQKLKAVLTSEVVCMGFSEGEGKFAALFGAIEYGQYLDGVLTKRGKCSGMDEPTRLKMHQNPEEYIGKVMEMSHMGIDKDSYRHPRFKSMRVDKSPEECTWEQESAIAVVADVGTKTKKRARKVNTKPIASPPSASAVSGLRVNEGVVNKLGLDSADALHCSAIARCRNASSDKFYQVFVSVDSDGDYVAWAAYGRWDGDTDAPKSVQVTAIPVKNNSESGALEAANKKLGKKLGSGYQGELI